MKTPSEKSALIPRSEIAALSAAILALVNQYGHPDEIPVNALIGAGISPDTAEKCFALLTSESFPSDPTRAVAKWMRLIGEFSE